MTLKHISVRAIYREIGLLRLSGVRIEGERGCGYRLIEDYALPQQTFDRLEIEAITLVLGEVPAIPMQIRRSNDWPPSIISGPMPFLNSLK